MQGHFHRSPLGGLKPSTPGLQSRIATPSSYDTLEQEYAALLREIDATQQYLRNAVSRYNELRHERDLLQAASGPSARVATHFEELSAAEAALVERNRFLVEQIATAKLLYQKACDERLTFDRQQDVKTEREALEHEFLEVRQKMGRFSSRLPDDVELLRAALGEQRYEIYLLQSHLATVKRAKETIPPEATAVLQEPLAMSTPQLIPAPPPVSVAMDERMVPVERGKLRLLTGPRGDGLKRLRDAYQVMAVVVAVGDHVAVKVKGHSRGVDQCAEEIGRVLRGF